MRRSASGGGSLSSSTLPFHTTASSSAASTGILPFRMTAARIVAVGVLSLLFVFLFVTGLPSPSVAPVVSAASHTSVADLGFEPTSGSARRLANTADGEKQYVLLVDAGSSGSRVHVHAYYWPEGADRDNSVPIIEPSIAKKIKPGLSSYGKHPERAGDSLKDLVDFAKSQIQPMSLWTKTPIHVQATAGLRSIPPQQAEAVLENVRDWLSDPNNSPFQFQREWALIIPGAQEGINGWLTVNYLLGVFGRDANTAIVEKAPTVAPPSSGEEEDAEDAEDAKTAADAAGANAASGSEAASGDDNDDDADGDVVGKPGGEPPRTTFGVVEMGGASIQLTFEPHAGTMAKMDPNHIDDTKLIKLAVAGSKYLLYTHSYLNYGLEAVQELFQHTRAIVDAVDELGNPCYPTGFRHSSAGDFDRCFDMLRSVVNSDTGSAEGSGGGGGGGGDSEQDEAPKCVHASCSFNGVFQPVITKEKFFAIENFFYTSQFFKVHTVKDFLGDLKVHGRTFCNTTWSKLMIQYPPDQVNPGDLAKYCFSAAYVARVLNGMGMRTEVHDVRIAKEIASRPIDWALGAVLYSLITPPGTKLESLRTAMSPATEGDTRVPKLLDASSDSGKSSAFIWMSIVAVPSLICYVIYKRVACVPRNTSKL